MNASQFIEFVVKEFGFLVSDFNFRIAQKIKDELVYGVLYKSPSRAVQIYFEVLDQASSIVLFRLKDGDLPDWDDTANAVPLHKISDFIHTVYEVDSTPLIPPFDKEVYKQNLVLSDLNKKARNLKRIAKIVLASENWIAFPEIDKPQPPKVWTPEDDD